MFNGHVKLPPSLGDVKQDCFFSPPTKVPYFSLKPSLRSLPFWPFWHRETPNLENSGVSWMDLDSPEAQQLPRNYSLYQPRRMWPQWAFLTCGDVAEISIFGPRNGHVMPFHTTGPNVYSIAWGRIELPRWRAKPRTSICPFLVNWPWEDLVDNADIRFILKVSKG